MYHGHSFECTVKLGSTLKEGSDLPFDWIPFKDIMSTRLTVDSQASRDKRMVHGYTGLK